MKAHIFSCFFLYATGMTAKAQEEPFQIGTKPYHFISTGLTTGASLSGKGNGGFVGLETSYVRAHKGTWFGLYTDALYDFGQQASTITIGPELGILMFGIDGGLGVQIRPKEETILGFQARTMLSLGFFSLFYRYGVWPEENTLRGVHQIGITLKSPIIRNHKSRSFAP